MENGQGVSLGLGCPVRRLWLKSSRRMVGGPVAGAGRRRAGVTYRSGLEVKMTELWGRRGGAGRGK